MRSRRYAVLLIVLMLIFAILALFIEAVTAQAGSTPLFNGHDISALEMTPNVTKVSTSTAQITPTHINLGQAAYAARWKPDGSLLAIATESDVRLYDSALQLVATLHGHMGTVTSLSWKPDGTQLVSGSIDGRLIVWEIDQAAGIFRQLTTILIFQPVLTYKGYFGILAAWSPDGTKIAALSKYAPSSYDGYLGVIDIYETQHWALVKTLENTSEAHLHIPTDVLEWSPDSTRIAVTKYGCSALEDLPCPGNPTLVIIDVASAKEVGEVSVAVSVPDAISWSETGRIVVSERSEHTMSSMPGLQLIDGNTYLLITFLETGTINDGIFVTVDWSPDNTQLAGGRYDGTVIIVNILTGEQTVVADPASEGRLTSIAWSPNGSQIITVRDNGLMTVWDVTAYTDVIVPTTTPIPTSRVSLTKTRTPILITTATPTLTTTQAEPFKAYMVAWIPFGDALAVATSSGLVLLDTELNVIGAYSEHVGAVFAAAWRPDSPQLATGGEDGKIILWNYDIVRRTLTVDSVYTAQTAWNDPTHIPWQTMLAWSPDGTRLASLSADKMSSGYVISVHIWNMTTHRLERILDPLLYVEYDYPFDWGFHNGMPRALAWKADSSQLAVVAGQFRGTRNTDLNLEYGRDPAVHVFDVQTGRRTERVKIPQSEWGLSVAWIGNKIAEGTLGVAIVDLQQDEIIDEYPVSGDVHSMSPNHRGESLLVGTNGGVVEIIDVATGVSTFSVGLGITSSVAWSPDESQIVAVTLDGKLAIWNINETTPVATAQLDRHLFEAPLMLIHTLTPTPTYRAK